MISKASLFRVSSFVVNYEESSVYFKYETFLREGKSLNFTEKIFFPKKIIFPDKNSPENTFFIRLLADLHILLGVSYWKMHCAKQVEIKNGINYSSNNRLHFWQTIYSKGLGEFYYRNNIDPAFKPDFIFQSDYDLSKIDENFSVEIKNNSCLVGIGGGKDSIVSVELLKNANFIQSGLVVENLNQNGHIGSLKDVLDIPLFFVKREVDQQLLTLSDVYKGHVPVSAVYAFLGIITAFLKRFRYFIVSNEISSDSGNIDFKGYKINHQWSKSQDFETLFRDYIHSYFSKNLTYLSILRPFHEVNIVKLFTKYPQYFHHFSSCNRNFSVNNSNYNEKLMWCGNCPKCAFAFVHLSAFLSKDAVIKMFMKNLLADEYLIDLYKELLGIKGIKPFDCVGTFEETTLAFYLVYKKNEFNDEAIMKMFIKEVLPTLNENEMQSLQKKLFSCNKEALSQLPIMFQRVTKNEN